MKNIEILVATHKKADMPSNEFYTPIHVGKLNKQDLGYLGDDTGKNISYKNSNYCELTALYWYLKNRINLENNYVGLNHYRRYFLPEKSSFYNSSIVRMKFEEWNSIDLNNSGYLENIMSEYDVILPKKRIYPMSIKAQYATMHIKEHLEKTAEIIKEFYPEYEQIMEKYFSQNKSYLYNMFVIKKEYFISMMEWIFDILFKVESQIIIPKDIQQARVFGFLSERLVNIFILKNNLRIKELPVAFINDSLKINKNKYKFESNLNNLIFKLGNSIWDYMFFDKNLKLKKSKSKK